MTPQRPNILIVDDTHANLTLLGDMLSSRGYRVRPVPSGKLALSAAAQQAPDLVLLDINMPQMDGYEVCRRLKADPALAAVPVVFISALSDSIDKVRAFEVGGVDFVTKPFSLDEVHARVDSHLKIRLLQVELVRKVDELHRLERLRDDLTHMIVHDMRSVLSSLLGSMQLVRLDAAELLSADSLEDIDVAVAGGGRLVNMVNELLDIGRLEAGQMPLNLRRGPLTSTVMEACNVLGGSAGDAQVQTALPATGCDVRCDHQLIGRVVLNLLHNALKFSPEGEVIVVEVVPTDTHVTVRVIDRGAGVPEAARERIFEKFGQIEARRQGVPSTGLGLAFCKLAVEAHGGEIGVDSGPDGGSVFWFRIARGR